MFVHWNNKNLRWQPRVVVNFCRWDSLKNKTRQCSIYRLDRAAEVENVIQEECLLQRLSKDWLIHPQNVFRIIIMLMLLSWEGLNGYDSLFLRIDCRTGCCFSQNNTTHTLLLSLFYEEFLRRKQEKKLLTAFPLQAVISDEGGERKKEERKLQNHFSLLLYCFNSK